jgi:hypothetical protein
VASGLWFGFIENFKYIPAINRPGQIVERMGATMIHILTDYLNARGIMEASEKRNPLLLFYNLSAILILLHGIIM